MYMCDCLGCAVLLCLVCLTLLASFFLPSHLSLKTCIYVIVHGIALIFNRHVNVFASLLGIKRWIFFTGRTTTISHTEHLPYFQ